MARATTMSFKTLQKPVDDMFNTVYGFNLNLRKFVQSDKLFGKNDKFDKAFRKCDNIA